jgi:hypothetical protein
VDWIHLAEKGRKGWTSGKPGSMTGGKFWRIMRVFETWKTGETFFYETAVTTLRTGVLKGGLALCVFSEWVKTGAADRRGRDGHVCRYLLFLLQSSTEDFIVFWSTAMPFDLAYSIMSLAWSITVSATRVLPLSCKMKVIKHNSP